MKKKILLYLILWPAILFFSMLQLLWFCIYPLVFLIWLWVETYDYVRLDLRYFDWTDAWKIAFIPFRAMKDILELNDES